MDRSDFKTILPEKHLSTDSPAAFIKAIVFRGIIGISWCEKPKAVNRHPNGCVLSRHSGMPLAGIQGPYYRILEG